MKNGPGRRLRYGMCGTGTTNSDLPVDTYMTYGVHVYTRTTTIICTHEGVQLCTHTLQRIYTCIK